MIDRLPPNWASAQLADLCLDVERRQPRDDENFAYIDISSIDRHKKSIAEAQSLNGSDAPSRARQVVHAGDVLVSMTRPNLNAVALVPEELDNQIASTGFHVLRPVLVDPRWLFYFVRTDHFVSAMSRFVQGALYPAIRPRDIRTFEIPLAPLNEQTRILNKLDTCLALIDSVRERLEHASQLSREVRKAVLTAATSGVLTIEWRQDSGINERNWAKLRLEDILTDIRYGTSKKSLYEPEATPVLRIPNVVDGSISHDDMKYGHFTSAEIDRLALRDGDILMIRSNGSLSLIGRTALVSTPEEGFLFAGYLMRLRFDPRRALPAFVQLCLASPGLRAVIEETARSTSGVNNINAEEVKKLEILLPSLEEQVEIVQRATELFARVDELNARMHTALLLCQRFTPALLERAFRGFLLPQDPNDEPASALLEHTTAARAVGVAVEAHRPSHPSAGPRIEREMISRNEIRPTHLRDVLVSQGRPLSPAELWTASQLEIDDFYDQLRDEEAAGFLQESRFGPGESERLIEVAA